MGKFKVSIKKEAQLQLRMQRLGIREQDLHEKFVKASGRGGQKINKTSSCVYILHRPTGIEIKCQEDRSQSLNRFLARRELCDRLEQRLLGAASKERQFIEKIRRQKRRRSRRQKERMLAVKRHRSKLKELRASIVGDD